MVRAEKYIRFSQVTEEFLGHLSSLRRGFIVNSLQFTACWLKSVPSKVFAMVVRDGTARGKESL